MENVTEVVLYGGKRGLSRSQVCCRRFDNRTWKCWLCSLLGKPFGNPLTPSWQDVLLYNVFILFSPQHYCRSMMICTLAMHTSMCTHHHSTQPGHLGHIGDYLEAYLYSHKLCSVCDPHDPQPSSSSEGLFLCHFCMPLLEQNFPSTWSTMLSLMYLKGQGLCKVKIILGIVNSH